MNALLLRLLALAAAVAMVVGALAVRNRMDDDKVSRSTELRLLCATELEAACDAIEDDPDSSVTVTVEEVGTTLDRLAEADVAGFDGWLTPGPFPQMVRETRKADGHTALIDRVSRPLARSRVVIAMWKERATALATRCVDRAVEWKCLGDAAGRPWKDVGGRDTWGSVKTALPDPTTTAAGVVTLGAATATFFGQPDVGSLDINESDAYGAWLNNLKTANVNVDVARMLAAGGPSIADAAAGLEVSVKPVVDAAAASAEVSLIYPSPVATADVFLGTVTSERAALLAELLEGSLGRAALRAGGWQIGNAGLPPTSYLPVPGLLAALRDRWAQ
ncbi:MAG: hypothetical protein QOG87_2470 [Actinomycetota bacterium]